MQPTYIYTVPMLVNLLGGLKSVLSKAEVYAHEKGIDESILLNDAIASDMFPLKKQVQITCDHAKGIVSRLTGLENPKMDDTEQSFKELLSRIDKTLAFIQGVKEADFMGAEDRPVTIIYFPGKYFTGLDYLREYGIPNFMFHITTAYNIVRKNGVQIGKADFVSSFTLKDL